MNYYLDTEFIEGFSRAFPFGKKMHTIQFIQIGIVSADGRTYEAVCSEYNYRSASSWVKENVILPLYRKQPPNIKMMSSEKDFQGIIGKSIKAIEREIREFIYRPIVERYIQGAGSSSESDCISYAFDHMKEKITFYGYYADYDWVLFCSIFGRMIDLPKGFPMYCRDLKQTMDLFGYDKSWKDTYHPEPSTAHDALADATWIKELHQKIYAHAKIKINGNYILIHP